MSSDFDQFFNNSPIPSVLLNGDLVILACNAAYARCMSQSRESLLSRPVVEVFARGHIGPQKMLEMSLEHVKQHRAAHQIPLLHCPARVDDDKSIGSKDRYWSITNTPLLDDGNELRLILSQAIDVTDLPQQVRAAEAPFFGPAPGPGNERAEAQIRSERDIQQIVTAERDLLHQLVQQAPGFICVLRGPEHIIEMVNDAYYQLMGHRQSVGLPLFEAVPEMLEQGHREKLDWVLATGQPHVARALPVQLQRVTGGPLEQHYTDVVYQPIRDPAGQVSGIFVQGHDVTEAYELAREVSYQAARDPLTGLYNRREFSRQTAELDHLSGSHALLYMDLDHFKIINDRCGHAAGDALLVQVSSVLQEHIRETDLLARLGGDEFALVLRDCSEEEAAECANTLRRRVRDTPFTWDGRRYGVTLSVGVASFGGLVSIPFSKALSWADAACFLAKDKGRNRVQISHPGDEEIARQQQDMDWADRIRECIREDRVVLHGQRIFALQQQEGALECREILARMLDADGKLVSPELFIPAAERFGFIKDLDRHIIRKAFARLQQLAPAQRDRTRYFVNVSGITLSAPGFVAYIEILLAEYGSVRPAHVCFEVTETAAISNLAFTADTMRQLSSRGFSFALDDFGSGMSSFSYLEKLPVHYLKIDGEFIKGILTRPAGAVIVEAVAKVARAMNILTVAESIETLELLPRLRELGIDYGQGFALHRPEPLYGQEPSTVKADERAGFPHKE